MPPPKRNILFIQTDAQHYRWLGCLGAPGLRTPNLDRLVQQRAVVFDQAYACSAVCVPSRVSLMTGRFPLGHGVTSNEVLCRSSTEPSLGRLLQAAGHVTGYFGKTHFAGNDNDMPSEGWDDSFVLKQYNRYLANQGIEARYPEADHIDRFPVRYWPFGTSRIPDEHYLENVITNHAMTFIDQHAKEAFTCFVNYVAPHAPCTPLRRYADMYDPNDMVLPDRVPGELDGKPSQTRRWIEQTRKYLNDEELRYWLVAVYALLTMVDDNVGRLMAQLEEHCLLDQTLIVFTSDHGDFAGRYGIPGKSWTLSDDLVRVPLLVAMPGIGPRHEQAMVQNIDLTATMLQWVGVEPARMMHGRSLLPLLQGHTQSHRDRVFAYDQAAYSKDRLYTSMVRTPRWKYIASTGFHGELYDMQADPAETRNLDTHPDYHHIRNQLRDDLLQWHIDNTGGFHNEEQATYWIDETRFFDESVFCGRRIAGKADALYDG